MHLTKADIYKQGGCYGVARVRHLYIGMYYLCRPTCVNPNINMYCFKYCYISKMFISLSWM